MGQGGCDTAPANRIPQQQRSVLQASHVDQRTKHVNPAKGLRSSGRPARYPSIHKPAMSLLFQLSLSGESNHQLARVSSDVSKQS
jgi:hypothetical protein